MGGDSWKSSGEDSKVSLLRALVQFLIGELRIHMLQGAAKKKKKKEKRERPTDMPEEILKTKEKK